MSESVLTVVKPGQSIGDAVKQDIQQTAVAKQLVEVKKQVTGKLSAVINALMQSFAVDPDNAASTALAYAIGLSMGGGTSKEDFLKGVEKSWALHLAQQEEVREEQQKMLLNVVKNMMAQKRPIPPALVEQMKAIDCTIPPDVQQWIDTPPAPTPAAPVEVKN